MNFWLDTSIINFFVPSAQLYCQKGDRKTKRKKNLTLEEHLDEYNTLVHGFKVSKYVTKDWEKTKNGVAPKMKKKRTGAKNIF